MDYSTILNLHHKSILCVIEDRFNDLGTLMLHWMFYPRKIIRRTATRVKGQFVKNVLAAVLKCLVFQDLPR